MGLKIKQKLLNFLGVNSSEMEPAAYVAPFGTAFFGGTFDGEQEPAAYDGDFYVADVDYYELSKKAYTLVTINEYARLAISRLTQFAVGTGLRLHPEPSRRFLERKFNIKLDKDFTKDVQELWQLFETDKNVSITKEDNIHSLANQIFFNAFVSGDILVIKRVKNGNLEYQLVNGQSVFSTKPKGENDRDIKDGVEIDDEGRHVAYYVVESDGTEKRIPAFDSKGRRTAWLVYASDKRLNSVRGYSPLGAIVQKIRKIGQYAHSEIIAADANARFAAVIEQDKDSSGINPLKGAGIGRTMQNVGTPTPNVNNAEIENFKNNLRKIAAGVFFHVPKGQKMSSFDTKRPNVNYSSFLDGSMKYAYAALGIPYEIAILLFSNNFSASRAALKMFELIIDYLRKYSIVDMFYQIVYEQFFELECLKGNINAPKYLSLKNDLGYMDNAFTKAKFFGQKIPHIDEVKEVNAVIAKLKSGLITQEQALEVLGNGIDFDSLIERRKYEQEQIQNAGLSFDTLFAPDNGGDENTKEKEEVQNE